MDQGFLKIQLKLCYKIKKDKSSDSNIFGYNIFIQKVYDGMFVFNSKGQDLKFDI